MEHRDTGHGEAIGELIHRAKRYDREAFAALYRLTITPVYRYLAARVDSSDRAEELTQEVYLAALRTIERLRAADEAGLLGWLFQIARHKLADSLRQQYRRPEAPLADGFGWAAIEAHDARPEEIVEAGEARAALRQAVDALTPEQREVIVYKYVLGYGNDRTAALIGKNTNAVNQLHHRALAALHRMLTRRKMADARG